jgi:hypothetical protein
MFFSYLNEVVKWVPVRKSNRRRDRAWRNLQNYLGDFLYRAELEFIPDATMNPRRSLNYLLPIVVLDCWDGHQRALQMLSKVYKCWKYTYGMTCKNNYNSPLRLEYFMQPTCWESDRFWSILQPMSCSHPISLNKKIYSQFLHRSTLPWIFSERRSLLL